MYDRNDWNGRKPGQPLFMQVQLNGGKYRGQMPNKSWQERVGLRKKLADWEEATGDRGRKPEPMAMYDSDMKVYLGGGAKKDKNEELLRNIELNKKWAQDGK